MGYVARYSAYKTLAAENFLTPTENQTLFNDSGTEDAWEYLFDGREIRRFAVVTHHGDFSYVYPEYNTLEDAQYAAVDNLNDSIYSEVPSKIVDLDTGAEWMPSWVTTVWVRWHA